jgi:hypothetical protein
VIFPGGGSVVSATIAFSGTMAIGGAARAYYIRGLSLEQAKRAFRKGRKDQEKKAEDRSVKEGPPEPAPPEEEVPDSDGDRAERED